MTYTTKPDVFIEAFRFGKDPIPGWFEDLINTSDAIIHGVAEAPQYCEINVHDSGPWQIADYGDYVIKYPWGDVFPCKRELFEQIYEEYE